MQLPGNLATGLALKGVIPIAFAYLKKCGSMKFIVFISSFVITLSTLLTAQPIQTLDNTTVSPDSALVESLARLTGQRIRLSEAKELALRNSTMIGQSRAVLMAAEGTLRSARGEFDPAVFGEFYKSGADSPSSSPFGGASVLETEATNSAVGLRMRLPIGTQLQASVNGQKLQTNSAFAALNPEYSATSSIDITQPLLRGFGPSARAAYSSARRQYDAALARYEQAVLDIEADVENKYWDLYASERDLAVQVVIRERGQAFLNQATLRAQAGLVGPSDVAKARVFVADQEQQVLDREEALGRTSDEFASMIGQRPGGEQLRYRTSDEPSASYSGLEGVDPLLHRAFENNRRIKAAEFEVQAARARETGGKWDAWPTLDLVGSIGGNGLAGRAQEIVFGGDTVISTFSGGNGDSWSQAINRDYPTWLIGVRFEMPIGLRPGRGNRDRLEAERVFQEQVLIDERRGLEEDIRAYHRELLNAEQRLVSAREGVDASMEQVRIGVLEYTNGRISAVDLVLLAEDLARAQQSLTRALVKSAKAQSGLRRLTSIPENSRL